MRGRQPVVAVELSLADSGVLGPFTRPIRTTERVLYTPGTPTTPQLPLAVMVTDLDTEHGVTSRDRLGG